PRPVELRPVEPRPVEPRHAEPSRPALAPREAPPPTSSRSAFVPPLPDAPGSPMGTVYFVEPGAPDAQSPRGEPARSAFPRSQTTPVYTNPAVPERSMESTPAEPTRVLQPPVFH